jgi:predicted nucleic acid-binding protein
VPAVYADASALVKLVTDEPQSEAVEAYIADAELLSSELALAEVPRALRRIAFEGSAGPLEPLLESAYELLDQVAMQPVEAPLLEAAGAIDEPGLRALDAVHVVTAVYLQPIDAFLTYDVRQAAVARLAGLRTVAPGF